MAEQTNICGDCGNEPSVQDAQKMFKDEWRVICHRCCSMSGVHPSYAEAVADWNKHNPLTPDSADPGPIPDAEKCERYAILDQIMPNADPMTRQRLEMAYDSGRISVLGKGNLYDDDDFNFAVRMCTAFQNSEIVALREKLEALSQPPAPEPTPDDRLTKLKELAKAFVYQRAYRLNETVDEYAEHLTKLILSPEVRSLMLQGEGSMVDAESATETAIEQALLNASEWDLNPAQAVGEAAHIGFRAGQAFAAEQVQSAVDAGIDKFIMDVEKRLERQVPRIYNDSASRAMRAVRDQRKEAGE